MTRNQIKHALPLVILLVASGIQPKQVQAQTQVQPSPTVEWKTLGWLDSKPPYGIIHTLTGVDYDPNNPANITGVHYDDIRAGQVKLALQ